MEDPNDNWLEIPKWLVGLSSGIGADFRFNRSIISSFATTDVNLQLLARANSKNFLYPIYLEVCYNFAGKRRAAGAYDGKFISSYVSVALATKRGVESGL